MGLGWCTLAVVLGSGCALTAQQKWVPKPAVPLAQRTRSAKSTTVARSLARLVGLLNRHGRRFGRCGRDHWSGAVGAEGALRLKRSYKVTRAEGTLLGRAAHRCAVLRIRHRFDQVTVEVNGHDLGLVGVSVKRGVVVAYCRRREYACVRVTELGVGTESKKRWSIPQGKNPAGLRRTALALHRVTRRVQRDPAYARLRSPVVWRALRRRGKIMRAFGIALTVAGIAGTVIGGIYSARYWPTGPCDGPLDSVGCNLARALSALVVVPGLVVLGTGAVLWFGGQLGVDRARQMELEAPPPRSLAVVPRGVLQDTERQHRRHGPPLRTAPPPVISLGWTFRF